MLDNPYRGINAHLHSLAQNPQRSPTIWTSIHTDHITHITDALNAQLPPQYVARSEQSMQIWVDDSPRSPVPDVAVYRTGDISTGTQEMTVSESVRVVPIGELLEEEITIPSVVIYRPEDHEYLGQPITRIELLSASNKLGGGGYYVYLRNRLVALRSGTSLIELDYLHQTGSPLPGIPRYPGELDSHAYTVAVTDRRESSSDVMLVYVVNVDEALPGQVTLPLSGTDQMVFDFDAVYQHTFRAGRWGVHLDYSGVPRNFDSYSSVDQLRIRHVMERL